MEPMRCGYCKEDAVAWIEWPTIGRPKGAMVCEEHLYDMDSRGPLTVVKWRI